jgi:hypothetical protein
MELKNDNIGKDQSNLGLLLDQYKHFVDSTQSVSERRQKVNVVFTSIHSFLITLIGIFFVGKSVSSLGVLVLGFLGIIISVIWVVYIHSLKRLNKLKFRVIQEMENYLPFKSYTYEWEVSKKDKIYYLRISTVEKLIPYFFILVYGILVLIKILKLI